MGNTHRDQGDGRERETEGEAWFEGTGTLIFILPYCSIAP